MKAWVRSLAVGWVFAAPAWGGAIVDLIPHQAGPYQPGQTIRVDVMVSLDGGEDDILVRLLQFAFANSDSRLTLVIPQTRSNGTKFWDFNPQSLYFLDDDLNIAAGNTELSVAYTGASPSSQSQLILSAAFATRIGILDVTVPSAFGRYTLDLMNSDELNQNYTSLLQFGFGVEPDDPIVHWSASSGELTGGVLEFLVLSDDPTQCCLPPPNGGCQLLLPETCLDLGGTSLPAGVTCVGDQNGDGFDDACASETFFALQPVCPPPSGGCPFSSTIVGNEIFLPSGGYRIWLEVKLGEWSPQKLDIFQAGLDAGGYANDTGAPLSAANLACLSDQECSNVFGPGSFCDFRYGEPHCAAGFVDITRFDLALSSSGCGVDISTPDFRYGCLASSGAAQPSTPGVIYYGGTLVLDIPSSARGTYEIGFFDYPSSFMLDESLPPVSIPILSFRPAKVTIASACCRADGACDDADPASCLASGGTAAPTDACLGDSNNNQIDDACESAKACCLPERQCTTLPPEICEIQGGHPLVDHDRCHEPIACCFPDSACFDLAAECCFALGGIVQGPGTTCEPGFCTQPCCQIDDTCSPLDPYTCGLDEGTPGGAGATCGGTAACCLAGGLCDDLDMTCCSLRGGQALQREVCLGDSDGDGVDESCEDPKGCCQFDGTCSVVTPGRCVTNGGTPQDGSNCPAASACCLPTQCANMAPPCCLGLGGTPPPDATCENQGACCLPNGSCSTTGEVCCDLLGGELHGPGTICLGDSDGGGTDDFCEKPEACCLGIGACVDATPSECASRDGTAGGQGTVCDGLEACCLPSGTCRLLERHCCLVEGGFSQGAGSACISGHCEACCLSTGVCVPTSQSICLAGGGSPGGHGSGCSSVDGACCLPNGGCVEMNAGCCAIENGKHHAGVYCLGDSDGTGKDDACERIQCDDVRRLSAKCIRGRLMVLLLLTSNEFDGKPVLISVDGNPVELTVVGNAAAYRAVAPQDTPKVCLIDPHCPDVCRVADCTP